MYARRSLFRKAKTVASIQSNLLLSDSMPNCYHAFRDEFPTLRNPRVDSTPFYMAVKLDHYITI